ncbi:MAG: DUF4215 domain-containing protein [Polyangiales bacterium]
MKRSLRLGTIIIPLGLGIASLFGEGCSSSSDAGPATAKICTPDAYVYCRCKDFTDGTKQCSADGTAFGACGPCLNDDRDTGGGDDTLSPPEDTLVPSDDTLSPPTDTAGPAADKCPGKTVAVDSTKDTVVSDDTSSATDDYKGEGACAVAVSKEHVYAVIPTGSGKLTVKMTGTGSMDPTLYARGTDCATGAQRSCGETTGAAGIETLSFNVTTGKTYWIFADGKAGAEGAYSLSFHLATGPYCGDGTVDKDEGCDDGNKTASDGCGNDCRPEGDPTTAGVCPGMAAHVWGGKTLTFTGSTLPYPNTYKSDACSFGSSAQDRTYAVTVHKTGTLTVDVKADYNAGITIKKDPCATGVELDCANDVGTSTLPQTETVSIPVTDGQTYYLVVDGALAYKGTFTVTMNLP